MPSGAGRYGAGDARPSLRRARAAQGSRLPFRLPGSPFQMRRPEKERGQPEEVRERKVEEAEAGGVQEENRQCSDNRLDRAEHPDEARERPERPFAAGSGGHSGRAEEEDEREDGDDGMCRPQVDQKVLGIHVLG